MAAIIMIGLNEFAIFSVIALILDVICLAYSINELKKDWGNKLEEPLFFSPWIFPIYKFDSKKG